MNANAKMRDMTQGSPAKHIFLFSLPLLLGNVLQQLYNMVDSWTVGNFTGDTALAAVGIAFPVVFLFVSLFIGLGIGSTVVIAQFYGAGETERVRAAIDTAYAAFLIIAIPISLAAFFLTDPILHLLQVEAAAFPEARLYLQIVSLGLVGSIGYNTNAGILQGLGNSKTPLMFLSIAMGINIVLDLLFVAVFRWGVAVCAGLLGGNTVADTIGNSFSSAKVHFWILAAGTLIFGAIGFFVAEMLIEKNFRVFHKKRVGEWAVLTVVLAAFLGALKLDLFRIEGKIPDVSEVKVVSLNLDYTLRYTEPDDIQKIIDLQKEILAQKEECLSAENQYYLSITYTLKDGKKLRRSYTVPVGQDAAADKDSVVAKVTALESDPDKMMQNMFGNYYKTNEYYAGSISFVDENGRTEDYRFTQEELDAVMEAVQKDVEAGNMTYYQLYSLRAGDEDNTYRDRYFNNLDISFYNPDGIIWNYSSYSVDGVDVTEAVLTGEKTAEEAEAYFPNSDSAYVEFGSKCTNIIETLKKLGILNSERKLMTYDEYDALMNPVTAVREKGIPHIS